MNSLLHSIRGFKVGDPTFTFDYESKGFDRSVWSRIEQTTPTLPSSYEVSANGNVHITNNLQVHTYGMEDATDAQNLDNSVDPYSKKKICKDWFMN